ncbi:hypothetical protein RJ55_04717 [Drechmeria coniospora]|nr:hypothetical protein RJ55_04717 [Drechmeria coniospora]
MTRRRDEAARPRREADGGRLSIDDADAETRRGVDDEALNDRNSPAPPTHGENPPRTNTDAARSDGPRRRDSYPPRRRSLVESSARRRHDQYELQTIPSRSVAEPTDPTAAGAGSDGSSGHDHLAADPTGTEKASVSNRIKSSVLDRTTGKAAKKQARASWGERAKDRAAAIYQQVVIEGLLRRKPLPPTRDGRHLPLNPSFDLIDERSDKPYVDNFIRSSRYTIYDFVPKQLVFQFSKLGNFYFLIMGILQLIPGLSTVGRWTTIVPLSIFVAFSMAKEGYDDYRRYRLDKSENRSLAAVMIRHRREPSTKAASTTRWRQAAEGKRAADGEGIVGSHRASVDENNDWRSVRWQDLCVGDVVRLRRDQSVPADLVLLHATGPNGVAYIETMALDGETNLKSKQACPLLAGRCRTLDGIRSADATVVSEDPNIDLYSYDGRVTVDGETLPLSLNNVVYRGSTLRNTTEAVGLVVNTGEECKIRMNANKNVHAKKPAMQAIINKMVLFQIFIVMALAGGMTGGYYMWEEHTEERSFYLVTRRKYDASVPFREIFFGYLIMFNTLIPLSLYISLEIVKIGQLILMQDVDMYDAASDTPMVANTTTILENLGQVSYIFSDKTGTLTENMMRFRKLSVAGVACLHDMDVQRDEASKPNKAASERALGGGLGEEKAKSASAPRGAKILGDEDDDDDDDDVHRLTRPSRPFSIGSASHWRSSVHPNEEPEMKTEDLLEYLRQKPNTTFSRKAKHFLLCIALCHTCLPEIKDDGKIAFQAASPDELALVEAARDLGLMLVDRPAQSIKLQSRDGDGNLQVETYQVLDVIEFSSKRKRMSIIIRMPDGRLCIFCKGADNVIMSRLKLSHLAEQKHMDVSRRASIRKTFEQDMALRRMSEHGTGATPRTSFALRRSTDLSRMSLSEGVASLLPKRQPEETMPLRKSTDLLQRQGPRQSLSRIPSLDLRSGARGRGRVDETMAANEAAVFERCFRHIDDFATEGLRTLLYAFRYLDEDVYAEWKELHRKAETSLVNRQQLIEEAGDEIEKGFELAGATAIEDKLQEGVPETIDKLRRANIKVWMLTGDKRETAINIGHSARLCKPFSELYILDAAQENVRDKMTATLNEVGRGMVPHSVLVVDGQTLAAIDGDIDLMMLFHDLVVRVDSVICCRASPSQKAKLVHSIRRRVPKSMTLAIGDGANDIGMIQASHVGIGISGREGLQAARISDYSIAQFRFLQKLLFVHGRWNYLRTGKYVLATFWKEVIFFLVQAHFQRQNGYSGTSLFESWSLTVFNSAFTSLPVILLGIFEKDLSASTLLAVPELYTFGQRDEGFNYCQYFGWVVMGIIGSVIIFFTMYGAYIQALFTNDASLFAMGDISFTVAVVFINIKLLILELHCKTVVTFGGFLVSVAGWFSFNMLISAVYQLKTGPYIVRHGFLHNFGQDLLWWATVLVGLAMLLVLELVVQSIRRVYWPTDQDLMQRVEKDGKMKSLLEMMAVEAEDGCDGADVAMGEADNSGGEDGISGPEMRTSDYSQRPSRDGLWSSRRGPPVDDGGHPSGMARVGR